MTRLLTATILAFSLLLVSCGGGGTSPAPDGTTVLQTTDTTVGTGATAVAGGTATVNYTGWLYVGTAVNFHGVQFDTSIGRTPFSFKVGAGQVIQGWDLGVAGMKVGGTRTLIIPASLAYGAAGAGVIPANAALVFTVELLAVQ